jgi:hypothetical protein
MKNILIIAGFIIILLFVSLVPVIFFFIKDTVIIFLNIDYNKFIDLLFIIIPTVFSGIIIIFSYMKEYIGSIITFRNNCREKENRLIKNYNRIIFKTLANYNKTMNEIDLMVNILDRLKFNPFFSNIINIWESKIKSIIEVSNDKDFRGIIRTNMKELIIVYRNNDCFDSELEYLSSLTIVPQKHNILTNDEKVFVLGLKEIISFSKEEKNIVYSYLDSYSGGDTFKKSFYEYKYAIIDFKNAFEEEVRNRKIDDRKLHGLLCRLSNQLFHFCESMLYEIFFMENFLDVLVKHFKNYYDIQLKKYKVLDEQFKTEIVHENIFLKKYIDKDLLYDYHKILG